MDESYYERRDIVAVRCACSSLSLKSERKKLCERLRCRWEREANVCLQRERESF